MNIQRAKITSKTVYLSQPESVDVLIKNINENFPSHSMTHEDIEKACGRYVRGKRKGQLRGMVNYEICTTGGWQTLGYGIRNGRVLKPGMLLSIRITDYMGNQLWGVGIE